MSETWVASTSEEYWGLSVEAETREAAVAAAPGEFGLEPGRTYFVGRLVRPDVRNMAAGMAGSVIDQLSEWAGEEAGDAGDGWPRASKEDEADLDAALGEVVAAWVERRGLAPDFFLVRDVTEHRAPEAPEGEPC